LRVVPTENRRAALSPAVVQRNSAHVAIVIRRFLPSAFAFSPMSKPFGQIAGGHQAQLHSLENAKGFRAEIADYGGTVVRLFAPDRHGQLADVVLGFNRVEDYIAHSPYFGCTVGRFANRIAHGRFTLDGHPYTLAQNNSPGGIPCHLHGGNRGFDKVLWHAEPGGSAAEPALRLRYHSADGEEGYPGNAEIEVTYTVTADNTLRIDYTATTDRATPLNLTNHSYFNLSGEGGANILGHVLTLRAGRYLPVNAGLIPLGQRAPVAGTPLDFTEPHTIGERIEGLHEQLRFAGGYDHCFEIDPVVPPVAGLALAATLFEPQSGRLLEVRTTEPGVQFYSGNFLNGSVTGKSGHAYQRRAGLCLETQHFPDAPNQPSFASTILRPGATFRSTTVYRFNVR